MRFTADQLRTHLLGLNLPAWQWQLPDVVFATVANDYAPAVWSAWLDSLRANAPECLEQRPVGGGKTRPVPRYIAEAGDCENHALLMMAHALMGQWISAAQGGARVGRAFGVLFYVAQPRAENGWRAGGHAKVWWINHAGEFRTFEPGDGEEQALNPVEINTAAFGLAA